MEDIFPKLTQGDILLRGLTQARLAALIAVKAGHISEMGKAKRPIGKDLAKRLAQALNTSCWVLL